MKTPLRVLRIRREKRRKKLLKVLVWMTTVFLTVLYLEKNYNITIQSPVVFEKIEQPKQEQEAEHRPEPTPGPAPVVIEEKAKVEVKVQEEQKNTLAGEASYYSRSGCLGCKWRDGHSGYNLYMHNGDVLLDEELTLALVPTMYRQLKNKYVTVKNIKTGLEVQAKVTDSGGFGAKGRVADLSVATKNAINCEDLCQVHIIY